jgi:tRNA threonylcarbamoyladenosine biosynthesis protein TsaB
LNALGIETATETVGVAVCTAEGVEAELALTGKRRHVEALTPAIDHLLGQVGVGPDDLEIVAVDIGPGLFTGLRVGVAAAKGLAQALGIGVVSVTSLDVLIAAAVAGAGPGDGLLLAAVDARRGELFAVLRHVAADGAGSDMLGPCVITPDTLAKELARLGGEPVHAVGDGALRYRDALDALPGVVVATAPRFPPPATLLHVALRRLDSGEVPSEPGSVAPIYMRDADARVNFERAQLA